MALPVCVQKLDGVLQIWGSPTGRAIILPAFLGLGPPACFRSRTATPGEIPVAVTARRP